MTVRDRRGSGTGRYGQAAPPAAGRWVVWLVMALCLVCLGACSTRIRRANVELRRANLEKDRQLTALRQQMRLQGRQIEALQKSLGASAGAIPGADIPQLVALEFGRYTGAKDTNKDDVDDLMRVYLRTVDQHGRFMLVTGRAVLQLVIIQPAREPVLLLEQTFEPAQFDKAYRDGITGTHYTLQTPLPQPLPDRVESLTVKLTFTEAATGVTLSQQQAVPISR